MFNPSLDIVIGLAFFFFLVSLLCSQIIEWIAGVFRLRGGLLWRALVSILGESVAKELYGTESIRQQTQEALSWPWEKGRRLPSYLSSQTFTDAVIALPAAAQATAFAKIGAGKETTATEAGVTTPTRDQIAHWFDTLMERVTGWYRRRTQLILLIVATVLTVAFSLDATRVYKSLVAQPTKAAAFAAGAQKLAQGLNATDEESQKDKAKEIARALSTADQELGLPYDLKATLPKREDTERIPGYLITILAAMLGAPFWFDLLNRFSSLRMAGDRPASTTDKKP